MGNDLVIRAVEIDDAEAIARLHAESWRVAYRGMYRDEYLDGPVFEDRLGVWTERLTAPNESQFTIVAAAAGVVAGFACAFADDDARWGTLLDNIHVAPQRKRAGIGTALIRRVALWSDREAISAGLYLWVLEANAPARRFYERLGATNAQRTTSEPPGGGTVISLRYVWPDVGVLIEATRDA